MNRRDIIIVSVLANMAVLGMLFLLAYQKDENRIEEPSEVTYTLLEEKPQTEAENEIFHAEPTDEVDHVLEDLVASGNYDTMVQASDNSIHDEKPEPDLHPPEKEEKWVEVTVKSGDVLEKIAKSNGTTVDAIMRANNLRNDRLKIGQVLRIPLKKLVKPDEKIQSIVSHGEQYYTIKNGDNPWKIAKQFHVKVDELLLLNHLDEESAKKLKAGDQIRVK